MADLPHRHQTRQPEVGGEVEKYTRRLKRCLKLKHFTYSVFIIKAAVAAAW